MGRSSKPREGERVIPNKQKPRKQQVLHPLGGEKTTKNHKDLYSFHFWPPLRVHVHTQKTHDGIVRFRFGLLFHSKPYLPGSLRAGVLAYQMSWKEIGFGVVTLLLTHRELHPPQLPARPAPKTGSRAPTINTGLVRPLDHFVRTAQQLSQGVLAVKLLAQRLSAITSKSIDTIRLKGGKSTAKKNKKN